VPRPRFFKICFVPLDPGELVPVVDVVDGVANDVDQIVLQKTKAEEELSVTQRVVAFEVY
jgi:hypothetical protein